MTRVTSVASLVALTIALSACGAAPHAPLASLEAVDRARAAAPAKDAERTAPQAVALADLERHKADEALSAGDEVAADLYAQRAMVALEDAIALTRLARAAEAERTARARADDAAGRARELAATRAKIEAENAELDKRAKIARELAQPPVSGPADPKREAARRVAAESLLAQARLLCSAARLLAKEPPAELDEAEKSLAAKPPSTGAQAIDAAARARAACLSALTRIRRAGSEATGNVHADALLSELTATGHYDVTRDERGVVVTLRDAFDGARLKPDAQSKVAELGRVLKSNAAYRAQIVVHDAAKAGEPGRAKTVASALAQASGVPENQIDAQDAGTKLPVVDPADAKLRPRNARLEIVFVSPTN